MRPLVSIIIPCRNEAATLSRCLDSILNSTYPADCLEVIVADGRSEDSSRALLDYYAEHDGRVRWIDNAARITPAGLNRAIEETRGAYILRVDAHSLLAPDYIAELVEFLETHPDAWGAGGFMTTLPETSGVFSEPIRVVLTHRFGVGNSHFRTQDGTSTAEPLRVDAAFNCCWRREVFDRVGMFHEQLVRSQDIELSSRIAAAGGTLWLVPSARTTYFAKSRLADYVRHNWINGVWAVLPAAFTGNLPVRVRHLIPLALAGALLLSSVIAALLPALRWLPLLVLAPYLAANLAASIDGGLREGRLRLIPLLPVAFAGLHLAYGAGSLWGCVKYLKQRWSPTLESMPEPVTRPNTSTASLAAEVTGQPSAFSATASSSTTSALSPSGPVPGPEASSIL